MAAVLMAILIIINFALPTSVDQTRTILLVIGAVFLTGLTFRIIQARLQHHKSLWMQSPVSDKLGGRLINTVVGVWLCAVTAIFALIVVVVNRSSKMLVVVVVLSYVGAVVAGRWMQKESYPGNLLPYGLAFTGALLIAVFAFSMVTK